MRATGPSGTLRVGYQWAADLGAWEMLPADRGRPGAYLFSASILRKHNFWLEQGPLDLALAIGSTEWIWRGVDIRREGNLVRILLAERPIVADRIHELERG